MEYELIEHKGIKAKVSLSETRRSCELTLQSGDLFITYALSRQEIGDLYLLLNNKAS